MVFYCRNGSVRDDQRKSTGFISHHEVKRRLVGDGMRLVIIYVQIRREG